MSTILVVNGSVRGLHGNTARLVQQVRARAAGHAEVELLAMAEYHGTVEELGTILRRADGFILAGGVYWNSCGSALQRFIEVASAWEASDVFLGKPAGVVLSMDSVGGMEVAMRLLGVLGLFGCTTPPFAAVVLSRLGQEAASQRAEEDVYSDADLGILVDNLLLAAKQPRVQWTAWPVKPTRLPAGPYPSGGILNVDGAPWAHGGA